MGAAPKLIAEDAFSLREILDDIYEKYRTVNDGEVATYIPELGKTDPNGFAICLATVDGLVHTRWRWKNLDASGHSVASGSSPAARRSTRSN